MNYKKLKLACYASSMTMSVLSTLSPLLFLSFHTLYDISYTKLGLLVFISFSTQLIVDLIFSFFAKRFHIPTVLRVMPILAAAGLVIMGFSPYLSIRRFLVPVVGVEPTRYCYLRILSPTRLPIPPYRHMVSCLAHG